jgi:hypothetical protein
MAFFALVGIAILANVADLVSLVGFGRFVWLGGLWLLT